MTARPVPRGLAAPFSDLPAPQPSLAPVLGQRDLTWQDAGETTGLDNEEGDPADES
jgi:hypothetical protein